MRACYQRRYSPVAGDFAASNGSFWAKAVLFLQNLLELDFPGSFDSGDFGPGALSVARGLAVILILTTILGSMDDYAPRGPGWRSPPAQSRPVRGIG